jgi:hypothetical protein
MADLFNLKQTGDVLMRIAILVGTALATLLIALGVGWVLMNNLPTLMVYGVGAPAYLVLLMILALATAIILFGVLRSAGTLSGSHFGYKIELGGPAAFFILVLLYGIWTFPAAATDFAVTFRFKPDNNQTMADQFGEEVVKRARVVLFLPKQTVSKELTADGYAVVENIPARYRASPIELNLSSNDFLIKDPQINYAIPAGSEPVVTLVVVSADKGPTKPPVAPQPTPATARVAIINGAVARITSGGTSDGRSPFCQRRTVQQCVVPTHKAGKLVKNTGSVTNEVRVGRAGWSVVKDTPEQVCIEFWAATGACETEVSIQGQATAVEEFEAAN